MSFSDEDAEVVLRPYKLAKQCGCKFYCGSDAHLTKELSGTRAVFEKAVDLLGLAEEDKFVVG